MWRLLLHDAASGPFNMAVDEALLCFAELGVPSVRLYKWNRPTLSFGYNQKPEQVCNLEFCKAQNIDVVRRITGGRALLHHEELTYTVTAPFRGPFKAARVKKVYSTITKVIRTALLQLRVPLDPELSLSSRSSDSITPLHLPCLSVPTGHEITSAGKKIVASAQRRRRTAFLQHGSILLSVNEPFWRQVTHLSNQYPFEATGLSQLVSPQPSEENLCGVLETAFSDLFGASASNCKFTVNESDFIARLEQKYSSAFWNGL